MKTTTEQIATVLSNAESELRNLIAKAATEGDYRGVDAARQVAVTVQEIRERLGGSAPQASRFLASEAPSSGSQQGAKGTYRKTSRGGYPKFIVDRETLTKIGWSKKQKKEYSHRVPRSVFDRTVQTMNALGNGKAGPFMAEQIIEKTNESEEEFVPSYQVYIVIAFLRNARCIKQHGRDGYTIPSDISIKAKDAWNETVKDT